MSLLSPFLRVYKSPTEKIRLGKTPEESHQVADGGYIVASGFEYDLLIGCGISDDISFEKDAMSKSNIETSYLFDGTIDNLPEPLSGAVFVKKNIGGENNNSLTNLEEFVLSRKYKNILLKMDIECGEYNWFDFLLMENKPLDSVRQFVIEFHITHHNRPRLIKILEYLSLTHHIIHIHGNNCCGVWNEEGVNIPVVIEITFLRNDSFESFELSTEKIPSSLDYRNIGKNEIYLSGYPYNV